MPRPDFPKTIFEFQEWFPDEATCAKFLIDSRWPDGFVCPRCGGQGYYWMEKRGLLQCTTCRYQVSPTAGTVMHRSRMPLKLWFYAAYLVSTLTPGISALQFQRQMGLSSYQTAFTMLHKLRDGMVRVGRDKISGLVEVDETYVGGAEHGKTGRGAYGKVIVAGAVEIHDNAANRVRLKVIPDVTQKTLTEFIQSNVIEGSTIRTDDWGGYNKLEQAGYRHIVNAEELIHIHRVFSNLKTWILGTHHGVSSVHLQAYLNEYTFRFNRRVTPMAAFQTALGLGSQHLSPTYRQLYDIRKGELSYAHPSNPAGKPK